MFVKVSLIKLLPFLYHYRGQDTFSPFFKVKITQEKSPLLNLAIHTFFKVKMYLYITSPTLLLAIHEPTLSLVEETQAAEGWDSWSDSSRTWDPLVDEGCIEKGLWFDFFFAHQYSQKPKSAYPLQKIDNPQHADRTQSKSVNIASSTP